MNDDEIERWWQEVEAQHIVVAQTGRLHGEAMRRMRELLDASPVNGLVAMAQPSTNAAADETPCCPGVAPGAGNNRSDRG